MSWIKSINYSEATGSLKQIYDRVKGPGGALDNILKVHSLRPHTLKGHMMLYKNVLHHRDNIVPKWFLEVLGVFTSMLNACDYCVEHHFEGLKRLLNDNERSDNILHALSTDIPEKHFDGLHLAFIHYTRKLTTSPALITESDLDKLRALGADDGMILEVNQVVSYFAYANRTVLGLGVTTEGDVLGLSPGDEASENNWGHQ